MTLADDVNIEEYIMSKDDLSGADIKAICTEAGLMALRLVKLNILKYEIVPYTNRNILYCELDKFQQFTF